MQHHHINKPPPPHHHTYRSPPRTLPSLPMLPNPCRFVAARAIPPQRFLFPSLLLFPPDSEYYSSMQLSVGMHACHALHTYEYNIKTKQHEGTPG